MATQEQIDRAVTNVIVALDRQWGLKRLILAEEIANILRRRNHDYGDAFAYLGLKGLFAAIHGKYWRLRKLVWEQSEPQTMNDTVRDSFRDLAGYGILGLVLIDNPELTRDAEEML